MHSLNGLTSDIQVSIVKISHKVNLEQRKISWHWIGVEAAEAHNKKKVPKCQSPRLLLMPQRTHREPHSWKKALAPANHRLHGQGIEHKLWTEALHWPGDRGGMWFVPGKVYALLISYSALLLLFVPSKHAYTKALCPKMEKKIMHNCQKFSTTRNTIVYEISHINCETKVKVLVVLYPCLKEKGGGEAYL